VGSSTHRDWDTAGLIFVNVEAGEKYVGEWGVQTSITVATMSGHGVAYFATISCYKFEWQHNCNTIIIAIVGRKFLGRSLHLLHTIVPPLQTYFSVFSSSHLALIVTQMLAMITCISNKCFGLHEPVQWGWSRQTAGSLECHHLHSPWYFYLWS
jgi:hypothetical protein